jgi:hypothetical protein
MSRNCVRIGGCLVHKTHIGSMLLVTFLILCGYSLSSKDAKNFQSIDAATKLSSILAIGDAVLNSEPFNFDSAKVYINLAQRLVKTNETLLREEVGIMDLQTELILNHLESLERPESSFRIIYWYKKWRLRRSLNTVIDNLRSNGRFLLHSRYPVLVALSSRVTKQLDIYRNRNREDSGGTIKTLKLKLDQFKKTLTLCQEGNSAIKSTTNEHENLFNLFTAGYSLLESESINLEALKKYLESVHTLLSPTKEDVQALLMLSQKTLKQLQLLSTIFIDDLEILCEILEEISAAFKPQQPQNQPSVSSIIIGDLQIQRTFDNYQETLDFLTTSSPLKDFKLLREYLKKSVISRSHIVPDYTRGDDIVAALDSSEDYFKASDDEYKIEKIYGFYFLAKYIQSGNNPEDKVRAAFTLKEFGLKYASKHMSRTAAVFHISAYIRLSGVLTKDMTALVPQTKKEYIKRVFKVGWSKEIFTMIAVSVITDFSHPLIQQVKEEFENPEYENFCIGAEQLRNFLEKKAEQCKEQNLKKSP